MDVTLLLLDRPALERPRRNAAFVPAGFGSVHEQHADLNMLPIGCRLIRTRTLRCEDGDQDDQEKNAGNNDAGQNSAPHRLISRIIGPSSGVFFGEVQLIISHVPPSRTKILALAVGRVQCWRRGFARLGTVAQTYGLGMHFVTLRPIFQIVA